MLRFVSAAVLAASTYATQLKAYAADSDSPPDVPDIDEMLEEGEVLERLERLHNIIDTNNDAMIDVTEVADLGFLFEEMYDVDFETMKEFAHYWLMMHHDHGKYISIREIEEELQSAIDEAMGESYLSAVILVQFINQMLDLFDFIIFAHGSLVDFFDIDEDDDYHLDFAELKDRNIAKWLKDHDVDENGALDMDEYMTAVLEENTVDYKYEGQVDEYATRMDDDGLLMGVEELEKELDYQPNAAAQIASSTGYHMAQIASSGYA